MTATVGPVGAETQALSMVTKVKLRTIADVKRFISYL
jgi:hypothetical protein